MITVLGGALVNLIPTSDQTVMRALPGGSAFNVAIGAARQGFPTALMARFSRDAFGQMLRHHAERNGVDLSAASEADEPTTIALMPASPTLNPHRTLYIEGTASRQWSPAEIALIPAATTVLHIGSAVHWPAPVRARIFRVADRFRRRGALVSVDLNIRPEITEALGETLGQSRLLLDRLLPSADVIRTSIEDIGWLYPERAPQAVAESWLNLGPGLVVVGCGAGGAMAVRGSGWALHRPPYRGNAPERGPERGKRPGTRQRRQRNPRRGCLHGCPARRPVPDQAGRKKHPAAGCRRSYGSARLSPSSRGNGVDGTLTVPLKYFWFFNTT